MLALVVLLPGRATPSKRLVQARSLGSVHSIVTAFLIKSVCSLDHSTGYLSRSRPLLTCMSLLVMSSLFSGKVSPQFSSRLPVLLTFLMRIPFFRPLVSWRMLLRRLHPITFCCFLWINGTNFLILKRPFAPIKFVCNFMSTSHMICLLIPTMRTFLYSRRQIVLRLVLLVGLLLETILQYV